MGRELQIRLVNITKRRGGATRKEGSDTERVRVAQSQRAERVNVYSECAGQKAKLRLSERSRRFLGSPAIIKRAISHRITIRKKRRRIIVNHWHPNFSKLDWNLSEPLLARRVAGRGLVHAIDVGAAPQPFFFGRNRIDNH